MEKHVRLGKAVDFLLVNHLASSQSEIAKNMASSDTTVSKALKGNPNYLTDRFLVRFARAYEMFSLPWLDEEKGDMLVEGYTLPEEEPEQVPDLFGNEHDMLIRLETEREAMRKVIRNVNDPQTALSLLADILTANLK